MVARSTRPRRNNRDRDHPIWLDNVETPMKSSQRKESSQMSEVDATTSEAVILPRSNNGTEPQHLLIAVLGDYWFLRQEHIPSATLATLLAEFGISEGSARQAMRRLRARKLLVQSKEGRSTSYGFPPRSFDVIEQRVRRVVGFGTVTPGWDQIWTVVTFSLPEANRDARRALRNRLRSERFGRLHDAVWISPHDKVEPANRILKSLDVANGHIFRASLAPSTYPATPLIEVFGAESLRDGYLDFIERRSPLAEGKEPVENALVQRTNVLSEWLTFRTLDPDLPIELLPSDWPRDRARDIFLQIYDRLGPEAEAQFRHILAKEAPELAKLASHHTSALLNTP